jgi:cation diffusion facilitator family transporter
MDDDRRQTVRRAGAVVLGANLALALAKAGVWTSTGSLAVGSEAVNSVADAVYAAVVLAGLYLTTRPPDDQHPHGHERIEPFVSLFVAAGVLAAGALVCVEAVRSLGDPSPPAGPLAAGVLAVGGAGKYALSRYCLAVGEQTNSPAITAAGADSRVDVLTAGAALAGVAGAGAGYPVLDPLAAAVVGVAVLATGVGIVRDNLAYLLGEAPSEDLRSEIVERALAHPEVHGVHDVVPHYVGPEVDVSLHVEVEGEHTLLAAHDIETDVVQSIRAIEEVDDVFVHVDPREIGEWADADDASAGRRTADPPAEGPDAE